MTSGTSVISLISERQDIGQFRRNTGSGRSKNTWISSPPIRELRVTRLSVYTTWSCRTAPRRTKWRVRKNPSTTNFSMIARKRRADGCFGLDEPLQALVQCVQKRRPRLRIEKRTCCCSTGPVGSSKSTIARLLIAPARALSQTEMARSIRSVGWISKIRSTVHWCPMHEEPLHLVPERFRADVAAKLNAGRDPHERQVKIRGELCPFCRHIYHERLKLYAVIGPACIQDIRVKRLDPQRKGSHRHRHVPTQDEKNQDSTELTGDINYRKIAEYGSDSARGRSTSTASSTLPTAGLSNLSKC